MGGSLQRAATRDPAEWNVDRLSDGTIMLRHTRSYRRGRAYLSVALFFGMLALGYLFSQITDPRASIGVALCVLAACMSAYGFCDAMFGTDVWRLSRNNLEVAHSLFGARRVRRYSDVTILIHWKYPTGQHGTFTSRPIDDTIRIALVNSGTRIPLYGYEPNKTGNFGYAKEQGLALAHLISEFTGWPIEDIAPL